MTISHFGLRTSQEWLFNNIPDPETLFIWRRVVERQMHESGIDWQDILYVLCNPNGVYDDFAQDGRTRRVSGMTLDGMSISIVCVIYEDSQRIKLIKVWRN